jgi:hypothetical protein
VSESTPDLTQRLQFLSRVIGKERDLLVRTDGLLFDPGLMTPERVADLTTDEASSERVDAFVTRFGRLQDTLGDKLLPALLTAVDGRSGPLIDNLNRLARLGWLDNPADWLQVRRLRNMMVHDYVEDPMVLCDALNEAHRAVPMLIDASHRWIDALRSRGLLGSLGDRPAE